MKQIGKILLFVFLSVLFTNVQAQQKENNNKAILDELNTDVFGKGKVRVFEDEAISGVLGRPMAPARTVYTIPGSDVQYYRMRGYKIQVFSGNNQRTSKNEAYHKQGLLNSSFPEHETVVLFESPFWRLRVGNFQTREEANEVMSEMREKFPSFGKEMYIVVDEVKILVNQPSSEYETDN